MFTTNTYILFIRSIFFEHGRAYCDVKLSTYDFIMFVGLYYSEVKYKPRYKMIGLLKIL